MKKAEKVINYYVMCNKLKNVIRTGWLNWNVKRERIESVAEHIYGVQMLAIAIYSEYKYDINIYRVITMLAVHELEEIIIGDLTHFQISKEEKNVIGHKAIQTILKDLLKKEEIMDIILEFDERKTKESIFAYSCDKLECDLQCKLYDEEGCVDLNNIDNIDNCLKELVNNKTWSDMWLRYGQKKYDYDKNFKSISNYALNNKISKEVL